MREILLYGEISVSSAYKFIEDINDKLEIDADAEIIVRVNTPGGEPEYGWGAVAKFAELKNKKKVKNDGQAHSMGLFFNCYTDDCECLDVTEFLLHRCAYPAWYESSDYFTPELKGNLERVNKNLRKAFEGKVDIEKFNNLPSVKKKGITLDDIFSMDGREELFLTAKEAKAIGLINKIIPITPSKSAEIKSLMAGIEVKKAASSKDDEDEKSKIKKIKIMDLNALKSEHPSVYNEIFEAGKTAGHKAGVAEEKDRIESLLVYNDLDPKAVKEAIEKGDKLTGKAMAEFSLKAATAHSKLNEVKDDNAADVNTDDPKGEASKEDKEKSAFFEGVKKESLFFGQKK